MTLKKLIDDAEVEIFYSTQKLLYSCLIVASSMTPKQRASVQNALFGLLSDNSSEILEETAVPDRQQTTVVARQTAVPDTEKKAKLVKETEPTKTVSVNVAEKETGLVLVSLEIMHRIMRNCFLCFSIDILRSVPIMRSILIQR